MEFGARIVAEDAQRSAELYRLDEICGDSSRNDTFSPPAICAGISDTSGSETPSESSGEWAEWDGFSDDDDDPANRDTAFRAYSILATMRSLSR